MYSRLPPFVLAGPYREGTGNKKTAVLVRETAVLKSKIKKSKSKNCAVPQSREHHSPTLPAVAIHQGRPNAPLSCAREPAKWNPAIYAQLTTGRFSDLRLTSRLLPVRLLQTVDKCLSDFRQISKQTLTAARPSRTLTGFPFDYPEARLRDLQSGYLLFKEQVTDF